MIVTTQIMLAAEKCTAEDLMRARSRAALHDWRPGAHAQRPSVCPDMRNPQHERATGRHGRRRDETPSVSANARCV